MLLEHWSTPIVVGLAAAPAVSHSDDTGEKDNVDTSSPAGDKSAKRFVRRPQRSWFEEV